MSTQTKFLIFGYTLGYTPKISQSCSFSTYNWAHSFSLYFSFGRLQIDTVYKFSTNECFPTVHCMAVRKEPPKSGSCGSRARPSEVLEFGTAAGFSVTCTRALLQSPAKISPWPQILTQNYTSPKILTQNCHPLRNLCVRPRILYRTNFHKCRCRTYFEAFSRDFPAS